MNTHAVLVHKQFKIIKLEAQLSLYRSPVIQYISFIVFYVCLWLYYKLGLWCLMPLSTIFQLHRGSWIYNYLFNQCISPTNVVSSNPVHGEVFQLTFLEVLSLLELILTLKTIMNLLNKVQSNLPMLSPLLSSHLYLKVTFSCPVIEDFI
jgi:hypothetical protein